MHRPASQQADTHLYYYYSFSTWQCLYVCAKFACHLRARLGTTVGRGCYSSTAIVVCWPWHLLDGLHAFTATKFTLCLLLLE